MVSPDSQAIACPLSGRNSTYRTVQISGTGSGIAFFMKQMARKDPIPPDLLIRQFPSPSLQQPLPKHSVSVGADGLRRAGKGRQNDEG
jgi:hypothetical protein